MKIFIRKSKKDINNKSVAKEKASKKVKRQSSLESEEGQLVIDVYQTNSEIVIQSPVAGAKTKELKIYIENNNIVLIKGKRKEPKEKNRVKREYLLKECYWGIFSRKIILPEEVDSSRTKTSIKEGILIIKMPKIRTGKKKKIIIEE